MTLITETTAQQIAAALWAKSDTPYTPPAISNPDIITDATCQSIAAAIEAMPSGGGGGSGITPYSTITAVLSFDVQLGQFLEEHVGLIYIFIQITTPSGTVATYGMDCALAVNQSNRLFLAITYNSSTAANNLRVWYLDGSGTTFTQITTPTTSSYPPTDLSLVVNQSNRLFMVMTSDTITTNNLRIWYLDGSGTTFTLMTNPSTVVSESVSNCALAVNQSNRLFLTVIYVVTTTTNNLRIWYLDGSGTTFTQITNPSDTIATYGTDCAMVVNQNNRLFLSIVYYNSSDTNGIRVWYLDGSATSFTRINSPTLSLSLSYQLVCCMCVNQSNRLFLAVGTDSINDGNLILWYLDGSATSFTKITIPSFTYTYNIVNCALAVNQSNRLFVSLTYYSTNPMKIWYIDGSNLNLISITNPSETVATNSSSCALAVNQSNRLFLTITYSTSTATNTLRVWYLSTNEIIDGFQQYSGKTAPLYISMGAYAAGTEVTVGKLFEE